MKTQKENYTHITKQTLIYQNKEYYYWIAGLRENPPLLLIPGLTGTHSNLLEFSYHLREHFYIIIPDLPGWGESPRPNKELTLSYYATYLKHLVQEAGFNKINVLGHCMGATIAIEIAHLFPEMVKKLVLVSVPYEEGTDRFKAMQWLTDEGEKAPAIFKPWFYFWRNPFLNIISGFFILKFRSLKKKIHMLLHVFKSQGLDNDKNFYEPWKCLMHYNYTKAKDISKRIGTHLIYGAQDLIIPAKQAHAFHNIIGQNASIDFIKGAGHLPPVETPDTLAGLVIDRLS